MELGGGHLNAVERDRARTRDLPRGVHGHCDTLKMRINGISRKRHVCEYEGLRRRIAGLICDLSDGLMDAGLKVRDVSGFRVA